MARIAGVNIPLDKRLVISLTYIYGIGVRTAHMVCNNISVDKNIRVRNLTDQELIMLRSEIDKTLSVEGDLRREVHMNIKIKKDIRVYTGIRHIRRLPVRGQNTHSNARTRKGKAVAIAGKKK